MSSPKKKLPTGPIRINPPATKPSETSTDQTQAPLTAHKPEDPLPQVLEIGKQDSSIPEPKIIETSSKYSDLPASPFTIYKVETPKLSILENLKQDSSIPGAKVIKTSTLDSDFIEVNKLEDAMLDLSIEENTLPESNLEASSIELLSRTDYASQSITTESSISESGLTETEYKKVAMRLSSEAVETLRQLRATTGVPYEIFVDVMIRNWDKLPQPTRAAYLQQAKQVRIERLIAGQEKTMKTMRTKYLEH